MAGKSLAAFELRAKWAGSGGGVIIGAKGKIEISLILSKQALDTYISDKLPGGSKLQQLA